ncbi:hypothetical protein AN639_12850 [Candidatus Epulonipiscium fishelsonii]|uniref:Uncharacterized protein n=1 Tax=Candidatus Epulonipiscium fishelsonii TaxID=77094 RepID=A0ACC8XD96_9FIRM|nr:hypothetical protein AN396_00825 [Epulopiscium sp. SCG-B11WGA-EpuloA1]ONI42179.1 hypothetical protein AN639_12850 [Epulopiscium sp. SCG-B05WGA-EpuloA1]
MYKLSGTKSQLIEDGIEIGMEKGIKIGLTEGIEKGKGIGLTEGIEKGKEQKQIEISKELLNVLDDLTISLTTKLPLAEIKKLRELHNIDRPHIDL